MRHRINIDALRNLAASVTIRDLARALEVSRPSVYAYLDGRLPVNKDIATKVNANLRRLQCQRVPLCEIVAAGLNNRANARLSVRSSCKGPMTKVEVLRYALGPIGQRYDASTNTLLVSTDTMHRVFDLSTRVASRVTARNDLLRLGLITKTPQTNLAAGIAAPHRTLECYLIDLTRIEWATLKTLCEISAKRSDPIDSGIVYMQERRTRKSGWHGMQQAIERATVSHPDPV